MKNAKNLALSLSLLLIYIFCLGAFSAITADESKLLPKDILSMYESYQNSTAEKLSSLNEFYGDDLDAISDEFAFIKAMVRSGLQALNDLKKEDLADNPLRSYASFEKNYAGEKVAIRGSKGCEKGFYIDNYSYTSPKSKSRVEVQLRFNLNTGDFSFSRATKGNLQVIDIFLSDEMLFIQALNSTATKLDKYSDVLTEISSASRTAIKDGSFKVSMANTSRAAFAKVRASKQILSWDDFTLENDIKYEMKDGALGVTRKGITKIFD